jgi:hypothetical protein
MSVRSGAWAECCQPHGAPALPCPAGSAAPPGRPTGVFLWGQGPLLLALVDRVAPDVCWEDLQ